MEIQQHVISQAAALAFFCYTYEFNREKLYYPFCNENHDDCITDSEQIQTLEEEETIHLPDANKDPEMFTRKHQNQEE